KEHAERVGLHLVMAGRLLDVDPERAYEHAQVALKHAGRIDIVREAAGLAAYRTNRFAEALRELRTVRRLNGSSEHLPIMADAERGLGRPERALALAASEEAATLDATGRVELAIVASGARSDLGEHDAALAVLDKISPTDAPGDLGLRVLQARAVALEAAGRDDEAAALLATVDPEALARAIGDVEPEEDVTVFDVEEDAALAEAEYAAEHPEELAADEEEPAGSADSADSADSSDSAESADSADSADSSDSPDSADSAAPPDEGDENEGDEPVEPASVDQPVGDAPGGAASPARSGGGGEGGAGDPAGPLRCARPGGAPPAAGPAAPAAPGAAAADEPGDAGPHESANPAGADPPPEGAAPAAEPP